MECLCDYWALICARFDSFVINGHISQVVPENLMCGAVLSHMPSFGGGRFFTFASSLRRGPVCHEVIPQDWKIGD